MTATEQRQSTVPTSQARGALDLVQRLKDSVGRGRVPAKIFNDPDIYQLEQNKLFNKCWNFLAHESEISKPGDYVLRPIGDSSILVARDESGTVNAHLNLCRHRGNQICKASSGNTSHFRCSYHGWVYKNDGSLVAVPYYEQAFGGNLDKAEWALVPVRIETYKGLIFGSLNQTVEPLLEYLGGFEFYMDYFLETSPGGSEVYGPPDIWETPADWKIFIENGTGDGYHTPVTHQFGFDLGYFASSGATHGNGYAVHIPGKGHGVGLGETPGTAPFFGYPDEVIASLRQRLSAEQQSALAPVRTFVGSVFPNLGLLSQPFSPIPGEPGIRFCSIRQARPLGAGRMQLCSWCLVPKDASQEYKDQAYRAYTLVLGPGGMFEQDDMENFNNITRQLGGTVARDLEFPYVMGLNQSADTDYPGPGVAIQPYMNDSNFRNLWSTWADYLLADGDES